jgi:hypothetical protein
MQSNRVATARRIRFKTRLLNPFLLFHILEFYINGKTLPRRLI